MELQIIEVKDLEVGDEIIISCQSYFKYLKILRKPTLSGKTHWSRGVPLYKAVKCSTRREEKDITWRTHLGQTITRTERTWGFGPENHNYTQYIDLEYRQMILIKKNTQ
jgi:hypothetical protein